MKSLPVIILLAVLMLSLSLNVHLGWRLASVPLPHQPIKQIAVGLSLPNIPVIDLDKNSHYLPISTTSPTLLYVLAPSCSWCKRNQANINSLSKSFNVVGLSLDSKDLPEYLASSGHSFPVYALSDVSLIDKLNLYATPQLAFVEPSRTVTHVWSGALTTDKKLDVEQFLHVELPGLLDTPEQKSSVGK